MHGEYKMPGGKLVVADLDVRDGKLADVRISGDFFLEPDSTLALIDMVLDDQPADAGRDYHATVIDNALAPDMRMYGTSPEAIATAVQRALETAA
ncbi:MAG: biotin--protein ligase [Rhodanobacteraceae bacterium]